MAVQYNNNRARRNAILIIITAQYHSNTQYFNTVRYSCP